MAKKIRGVLLEENLKNTMGLEFFDLSHPFGFQKPNWPYFPDVQIDRIHYMAKSGVLSQRITTSMHHGTHIDAPYHFGPLSEGREARQAADIPLEWCYGNGVVLDVSQRGSGETITKVDIVDALNEIHYELKPFDIVLLHTGADKLWGMKQYFFAFPGLAREALGYILGFGVKVVGVDTFSLDRPMKAMVGDYLKTGDNSHLWPAHFYGRDKEYCHVERLANLDKLPHYGFKVACFPIKVMEVGATWVRAVAIID